MSSNPVLATKDTVCLKAGFRLQWEEAQQGHVLLYPEGMVKLNAPAAAILQKCTQATPVAKIIAALETEFSGAGIADDVLALLNAARSHGWLDVFEP